MATMQGSGVLRQIDRIFGAGSVAGLSDGQLLERFLDRRDEAAFAALVARHGPMVLTTCRAILRDSHAAEDASQATFLILARRAGTIRGGEALGGWLHRVAVRVAAQAGRDAARRREEEQRAAASRAGGGADAGAAAGGDLRAALHAEIDRLPERYRLPIVLCHLEGLTRSEAAARLRWSEGSVRGRLARGRRLLGARLSRRGLSTTATLLAVGLAREASGMMPEVWLAATARAAMGQAGAGAVVLAGRALRSLLAARLRGFAAWVLLLGGVAVAATVVIGQGANRGDDQERGAIAPASAPVSPPAAPKGAAPAAGGDEGEIVEVGGRVLGPDGRPVAGARVVFHNPRLRDEDSPPGPPPVRATSDADGRFRFRIGDPGLRFLQERATWFHPTVAALADGYGPGWAPFTDTETARDLTLRLVRDDVPIVGRVLDLEGRPIAGVTVRPWNLFAAPDESLDGWLAEVAKSKDNRGGAMATLHKSLDRTAWAHDRAAVTGPDGRFRLTGIGRERVVSLEFSGPTIAFSGYAVHARTRPGPTYRVPMDRNEPEYGTLVFHGATFDYVASPSRPIVGVVRDQDTGASLPGVSIRSDRFAGNIISGRDFVRATTDAEGRYRLVGMPGGAGNVITAQPGPDLPYLGAEADVPGGGPEPAVVDFGLKRGVLIRGRVSDKATGQPVRAVVEYAVFLDNPHSKDARDLHTREVPTRDDGTFQVVGLPGRGLLAIRADEDRYPESQYADTIPDFEQKRFSDTARRSFDIELYHAFALVEPAEGARHAVCDVALDPGRTLNGRVLRPDGRPLAGADVSGVNPTTLSPSDVRLPTAEFTAIGLDPAHPRPLFFRHEERKLAAVVVLRGDEPEPPVVRLQPSASVSGQLLDSDGDPRTGFTVNCRIDPKPFGGRFLWDFSLRPTVDDQGRFRVEGLVPGVAYDLDAREGHRLTGVIARGLTLQPGESRDLGAVRADPQP